jgi:nucleoside 2-deoxyribosyltransferase
LSILSSKPKKERFKVSTYTRECFIKKSSIPCILAEDNISQEQAPKGYFYIGWDEILTKFPVLVSDWIDRTLINFSKMAEPGKWIDIYRNKDWIVTYAEDEDRWKFVVWQLREDKLIDMDNTNTLIIVTPRGWNRVADIERGTAALLYKQAFVAMWFDGYMDQAWESGFKSGIEEDTGFKAVRVDLKEHNEKICDVIIAEIRKSSFLVADFTGNRGGVYYEAGFAKGLGIPVIFTCQKGEWEKHLHFDTRQYNHIIWENPEDLKIKLKNRMRATIPILGFSERKI